jgi:hypothetical protein
MRHLARISLAIFTLTLLLGTASLRAEEKDGATDLLPGGELGKHWTAKGNWKVADGVVSLTPREGESGWLRCDSYLWLGGEYDDFEMSFDYMLQKGGNSGFYFNVGDKNDPVAKGIEVQIYESGSKGANEKLTDHDSGGVIPGIPPAKNAAKPAGEWNHFDIAVKGDQLTVKLNGEVVNQIDLSKNQALASRPAKGFIGFQDHALPISLRNLKITAK